MNVALAWILVLACNGAASAVDTIKTTANKSLSGHVAGMDRVGVQLEQGASATVKDVPANEILMIHYEGEPRDLQAAKVHVTDGHYAQALAALERIKEESSRPEIQQDIDFYKALSAAKLALGGSGKIADAGRMMKAFADANPKSYHYFEASETVGDLLVAIRQYAVATEYYARLQNAPWPDYKMRAGVASGRALLEQDKTTEALAAFDKVLATDAEGDAAGRQRLAASVGKAAVLVALKKPDDAVKLIEDVLKQIDTDANPDEAPLAARAYNVLGTAQRQAGRVKEALLAFLHVDILYPGVPDAHAEALANLAELWDQVHKGERANRARQTLQEQYKDSPWAKKAEK